MLVSAFVLRGGRGQRRGGGRALAATAGEHLGRSPLAMAIATLLLAGGLVCELSLHYHLAVLLIVAAVVVARREGELSLPRLIALLAASVVLALLQAAYLHSHAAGSPRQILGLMLGWPSVWPFVAIASSSPVATLLAAASLGFGLWRVAHRERAPDFVLLVLLGAWLPLIMIGFILWNIPFRYAEAQSLPVLIGAFAMAQWAAPALVAWMKRSAVASPLAAGAAAVVVCILVTNPVRVAQAIDTGYASHPDHKGAAEFIESMRPGPRDIIVAEDVLQQTYYLGHVDFWLVNKQVGETYLHRVNDRWLDMYTDTPMIGTGEDLKQLLERPDRGAVWVVGSGENQEDGRKLMRAFGIADELRSPRFRVVYRGRDGVTEVWKADAPHIEVRAAGGTALAVAGSSSGTALTAVVEPSGGRAHRAAPDNMHVHR